MTEQQPEKLKVVKDPKDDLEAALEKFSSRRKEANQLDLDHKKEDTRSGITKWVLRTFCILAGIFTVFVCGIAAWGDVTRLSAMSEMVQLLLSAISPVVTFILGYYFATKDSR